VFDGDQPFVLELAIRGGDGIEINAEIGGHLSNRRKRLTFGELTAGYERAYAVGHLLIDGTTVFGINGYVHCMVYVYSILA
jgi:hypothetical protein